MAIVAPLFRKRMRMIVSCLLIVAGAFGAVYAVKASLAQRLYLKTKYGLFRGLERETPSTAEGREVGARAYQAYALYPKNYYFPTYAAKCALDEALAAENSADFRSHLTGALYFSKLAMAINPYEAEGRMLYALIMAEDGRPTEAIAYWRDTVLEHEFWNSDNHNFMARLYLRSSKVDDMKAAVAELPFVSDAEMKKTLQQLKKGMGQK